MTLADYSDGPGPVLFRYAVHDTVTGPFARHILGTPIVPIHSRAVPQPIRGTCWLSDKGLSVETQGSDARTVATPRRCCNGGRHELCCQAGRRDVLATSSTLRRRSPA